MTRIWKVASSSVALLAVVVGFAFLGSSPAHAQGADGEYVDLAVILETPTEESLATRDLTITVMNLGSRTAYDVEVVVVVVYPENSSYFEIVPEVPIGTATLENGGYSFRWTIPEFLGMQRFAVEHYVRHWQPSGPAFDRAGYPHEFLGEVTTASFESDLRKGNNTDRVWSTLDNENDGRTRQARPDYSINVSVDERNPSPGNIVNFTVTTNHGTFPYSVIDQAVSIELTSGLMVDVDPNATPPREISYAPDDRAASVSYSNGVFNLGTLKFSDKKPEHSVTLPIRVAPDAVVNEQCLTATITGNPPPEASPYDDDRSDNVAKLCLGGPPDEKVVFRDGTADLWALYPCVGVTSAPCDDTDSVVLAINGLSAATEAGALYPVFIPDNVVVHIPDEVGRNPSDGNVLWNNGHDADHSAYGSGIFPGLVAKFERSLMATDHYSQLRASIVANTPGEGGHKGHVSVVWASSFGFEYFDTAEALLAFGPEDWSTKPPLFFRFTKLGTYVLTTTMGALYDSDPSDGVDPLDPGDLYSDTATYTFHVGPMAELEVGDGGSNSHVGAGQYALTIVAANNGPDNSLGAQVTGLPIGAEVLHISHGAYDGAAGEWNFGELRTRDYYRSRGETEPTLVLSASASQAADVAIENSVNYTVCISSEGSTLPHTNQADCKSDAATTNVWYTAVCVNTADGQIDSSITVEATCDGTTDRAWTDDVCASSDGGVRANRSETECDGWFQGTVYDYDTDNNTATITARAGTGGVGEGIPAPQTPAVHTSAVGFTWSEVGYLHGVPVTEYQVQWSTDGVGGWTQLDSDLPFPELLDLTIQTGQTRYYRVRAVNEAGVGGPWSAPVAAMTIDTNVPGITISEKTLTIREGESAEYTVALHARPHSNVSVRINGGGVVSPNPSTLTFNTIDFNMPKTVELTGIQDNNPNNEQVNVTHTISSSDAGYRSLTPDPVAVTVIDDDSGVSVTADRTSVNEGEDIDFTLTRTGNIDSAITVDLSVSQRGSVLPSNQLGARSVNIGANVATATVTVQTDNDTVLENTGSVTVALNSGIGYLVGTPRTATVNVQDDDGPPGQPVNSSHRKSRGRSYCTGTRRPAPAAP